MPCFCENHNYNCDADNYCGYFRDTAFTALAIDSHTDGNYFHEAPGEFPSLLLSLSPSGIDYLFINHLIS